MSKKLPSPYVKKTKLPVVGFISQWPSRRIVKVKVGYRPWETRPTPLLVTSLDKNVPYNFGIISLGNITLYRNRRTAEKEVLEQLHEEYAQARRDLREQTKVLKNALKRVEEWKAFKQVMTTFDSYPIEEVPLPA